LKGKAVDIAPNGDIIFEFDGPSGKRRRSFKKSHPSVVEAMKPKKLGEVDAAAFPVVALVLPFEIEFPDDETR